MLQPIKIHKVLSNENQNNQNQLNFSLNGDRKYLNKLSQRGARNQSIHQSNNNKRNESMDAQYNALDM